MFVGKVIPTRRTTGLTHPTILATNPTTPVTASLEISVPKFTAAYEIGF